MQFIPSTWSVVGVDADGDAKRNPQDIDDAALAAAVYLCSGNDDLATEPGQRTAVFRYNHSDEYVDLVLSIMNAYLEGDYTSVPNYITSAVTFTPDYSFTARPDPPKKGTKDPQGPPARHRRRAKSRRGARRRARGGTQPSAATRSRRSPTRSPDRQEDHGHRQGADPDRRPSC